MDKLFDASGVKFNKESSSLKVVKNNKEENELLNNNSKNGVCCKDIINGCHSNNSPVENNIENNEIIENDNSGTAKPSFLDLEFLGESNILNGKSHSDDSNVASSNNSTDNLSYLSDNCIVEEVIISDEEISRNSDDCIYAYRGGAADFDDLSQESRYARIVNNRNGGISGNCNNTGVGAVAAGVGVAIVGHNSNNQIDDETDFLEMDFEPDPASELEQSIEKFCNDEVFNNAELKSLDMNSMKSSNEQKLLNGVHCCRNENTNATENNCNSVSKCNKNDQNVYSELISKKTGAKRKKVLEKNSPKSLSSLSLFSSSCTKMNTNNGSEMKIDKSRTYQNSEMAATIAATATASAITVKEHCIDEDICLDCLEREFLSKTIGKSIDSFTQCSKCTSLNQIPIKYNEFNSMNQNFSSHFKSNNEFNLYRNNSVVTSIRTKPQKCNYQGIEESLRECISEKLCFENEPSESVKFSSINVDDEIVVQALDKLGVIYHANIIFKYLDNENVPLEKFDVPEFIVYMSKKNCDYKRIIKVIKMACEEEIHAEFIPDKKATSQVMVDINMYDIIKCWNRRTDLGELKKLDKRFKELNVLGKIVNILRQAQRRNTKPLLGETMKIPQYYESGYICIKKIK